jgi:hypothetical protein
LQRPKNNLQAFLSNETQPKAVIATLATQQSTKPDAELPPVTSSQVITKDQLSAVANAAAEAVASTCISSADDTRSSDEDKTAAPVLKGTSSSQIIFKCKVSFFSSRFLHISIF